jgi:microcystin-dependent protein
MQRIRHTTAAPDKPDYSSTGDPGFFIEGAPGGPDPTFVSADWANSVQEEIAAVIEDADIVLDEQDDTQLLQAINAIVDAKLAALAVFPVGSIMMRAVNNAAAGWLMCDGAEVSRSAYAALFAAIGETFGAGDGATTFTLPDLRDYFPRCHDARTGRPFGSTQSDAVKLPALSATIAAAGAYSAVLTSAPVALWHPGAQTTASGGVSAQTLTAQDATATHRHDLYMQYTTVNRHTVGSDPVNVVQFIGNGIQPGQTNYGGGHTNNASPTHTHLVSVPEIPSHTHFVQIANHDPHAHQVAVSIPDHTHSIAVTGTSAAETRPKNRTVAFMIRAV